MITLNYRDARPIYEQVRDGLRRLIVSGAIADGEKLPSVRALASQLAINPNTIQRAYSELESEGYAASVPGKGSFAVRRERAEDDGRRLALTETLRETLRELRALGMTTAERRGQIHAAAPPDRRIPAGLRHRLGGRRGRMGERGGQAAHRLYPRRLALFYAVEHPRHDEILPRLLSAVQHGALREAARRLFAGRKAAHPPSFQGNAEAGGVLDRHVLYAGLSHSGFARAVRPHETVDRALRHGIKIADSTRKSNRPTALSPFLLNWYFKIIKFRQYDDLVQ